MDDKRSIRALRRPYTARFFHQNRLAFALAVSSSVLVGGINLVLSWVMQQLVDAVSGTPGMLSLGWLSVLTAATIAAVMLVSLLYYLFMPRFIERAMRQYKEFVFEKLMAKSISSFQDEATTTYVSALSNDANSIEVNALEKLFDLATNAILFVGAFVMMLLYSPLLTLAAVALSLLPLAASMLAGNRLATAEKAVSNRNKSFVATLTDSLGGFSVVKSFKAEKEIFQLFAQDNREAEGAKRTRRQIATLIGAIGAATGAVAQLGVFLVG
ncbi:MAG: ABC transporter ATP-binding protein, partial [Clostridiaceae bacterium]|nr:ABC transporter ATP-binding protein [Clostridiaceae bacterium]